MLSISTVARMLVAPNKGHCSARRYHGVVNARVPKKSNSRRNSKKGNKNHLCMSVMAYMLENGVDMQGCVDVWSVDDKAKLKVSSDCPCVSRYHQIRRFFLVGDAPEYKDHDFPTPGYHLCPSGYKELVQEPWQRKTQYYDKHGRLHLPVCREGPLKIVLRACKYQQSNAMSHANDLYRMYKGKPRSARKPVLMCYADGGPDWQIESQKTFYYYGRFFMKSGLDAFGMGSGGGGYSAFNPIERSWAPVSRQLSSVYLSDKLPGEDEAPIKQSGLTATQLADKEHVVFDSAMEHAAKLWNNNFSIGGHPVMAEVVPCAAKPTPFDDMDDFELWTRIASTHVGRKDKIRKRLTKLKVPATEERVQAMVDITKRMRFFTRHVDRRSEFMLFRKGPPSCCEWCSKHPRRKESAPFFDLIRRHGTYFTPQKDPDVPGSYKTYLQVKHHRTSLDFVPNKLMEAEFGPRNYPYRCQKKGCHWFFNSKADFDRHRGRAWCKAVGARPRKPRKPRRSRAVGAAADQRAERRQKGRRFKCAHPDCVAGQLNQSLTRQKRAAHWQASPAHKPPAKKAKQAKPRHLTPGRSLTRPAAAEASGTAASTTATSTATDDLPSEEDDHNFEDGFIPSSSEEEDGSRPPTSEEEIPDVGSFTDADHDKIVELLVEDDGVWRHATIFQHKESRGHVLWFNGTEEYEGIGGTYQYANGTLADSGGEEVKSKRLRWWRRQDKPEDDYCGSCYELQRYKSKDGAARARRAAARSESAAPADASVVWLEVDEDNTALACDDAMHLVRDTGVYEAECDSCGASLRVTPQARWAHGVVL